MAQEFQHAGRSSPGSDVPYSTATAVNPSRHPMGHHLLGYVEPKVHHLVRVGTWREIRVVGKHARDSPYVVSDNEKNFKLFNWHRPTARVIDSDTLEIACFPGRYYVQHYALIIATYLSIVGKESKVRYESDPDVAKGLALMLSQLEGLGHVDTVVIGYVDSLDDYQDGKWQTGSVDHTHLFSWKRFRAKDGTTIVLLGCMFSFWGDISVQLIKALSQHGLSSLIYAGKAAALRAKDRPGEIIVTGGESTINASMVTWDNIIRDAASLLPTVREGRHITIPSPLVADLQWTTQSDTLGAEWVDCEVGLMARECNSRRIGFAYLHIVSDNLSQVGSWGLWNERSPTVQEHRAVLFRDMSKTLKLHSVSSTSL